jgi:NitT/TauT family transport system ATP-binding protein
MRDGKTEPILNVKDLSVHFDDNSGSLDALQGTDFSIDAHEFVCVLGPSGSGKSVLMRVLAGLVQPSAGSVKFALNLHNGDKARIGLVFQQANLMPWRRVLENITLPLEMQGVPAAEARLKAAELIELIGLQGFENSWPQDLSGGMAQRVALARALILDPHILLLDEPFGALDALTREHMNEELLNIWQQKRKTVIMVTHSISEAVFLSDRILIFSPRPGRVSLDVPVNLPRPRTEETRYDPRFAELSRQVRSAISQSNHIMAGANPA